MTIIRYLLLSALFILIGIGMLYFSKKLDLMAGTYNVQYQYASKDSHYFESLEYSGHKYLRYVELPSGFKQVLHDPNCTNLTHNGKN